VTSRQRRSTPAGASALERFFFLDDADRALVGQRRGDHNRLSLSLPRARAPARSAMTAVGSPALGLR
jgi:Domain of unknown function (DUF4158)